MFCQKCGVQNTEQAAMCISCNTPLKTPNPTSEAATDRVRDAAKDALGAFKMFVSNPVPGLPAACGSLEQSRALGVGVVFGVAVAICIILAVYRLLPEWGRPPGFGGFMKIFLFALVPFGSVFGATFLTRLGFRAEGGVGSDAFIAGAALLPLSFAILLAGMLGLGNFEVIALFSVFALCLTILMLFSCLSRFCRISERSATIAVPLILIASAWLSKIIYTSLMEQGF